MLFENVSKILDVAKEKDVDILVARDMVINDNKENKEEIKKASEVIETYYKFVTACRVAGDEGSINKLCDLYEAGDKEAIADLIKE